MQTPQTEDTPSNITPHLSTSETTNVPKHQPTSPTLTKKRRSLSIHSLPSITSINSTHSINSINSTNSTQSPHSNHSLTNSSKPPWPTNDVTQLFLLVEKIQLENNKASKMTKALWKMVPDRLDTDFHYTWSQCHIAYTRITKEKRKDAKKQRADSLRLAKELNIQQNIIAAQEKARQKWQEGANERAFIALQKVEAVAQRFGTRAPDKVLKELEIRPKGREIGIRTFIQHQWKTDVWQQPDLEQFGRTWLYGYATQNGYPDCSFEFHHDGGKERFQPLIKQVKRCVEDWEMCTRSTGPELEREGAALRKMAQECLSKSKWTSNQDNKTHLTQTNEIPEQKDKHEAKEIPGWWNRVAIELGKEHICHVQLLVLSTSLRLKVLDRESELSSLRSTGVVIKEKPKFVHHIFTDKDKEIAQQEIEMKEKEKRIHLSETAVDVVRYSPSIRRERSIRSLIRDADLAVNICEKNVQWAETLICKTEHQEVQQQEEEKQQQQDQAEPQQQQDLIINKQDDEEKKNIHLSISWKRKEDLHILARTKLVRALALAVGGTHWIISEWCRGYSTISTVAESIVANSTILAMNTAVPRVSARYLRDKVRHLWHQENRRLKVLDETELRRNRARLRQEYRKHKKRGRPGRIEMKQTKRELDVLQFDLDHCLAKKWHPEHSMMRPSIETPREWERLGLTKPVKEKVPDGWIKIDIPYYHKKADPYYVVENTGICHQVNPLNLNSINDKNESNTNQTEHQTNQTEHQTEHQTKHQTDQINTETLHSNKSIVKKVQIIDINQDNVQEQHRNYFKEAMQSVNESIALLTSIQSPILYEATAAKARVAYAAACVGDSDGNQATGLQMEASMLINMSCECMEKAMVQARDAGMRYTLEYAALCRRAARHSAYRRHDGDISDAAERLKEALGIYESLDLIEKGVIWLKRQAVLELDQLGKFTGYTSLLPEI